MRTPEDALRSVKRYISEALAPQPSLCELVSSDGTRWTVYEQVAGAISVDVPSWNFLVSRSRQPPAVVGTPEESIYYMTSLLKENAGTLVAAAFTLDSSLDLRVGAPANDVWNLPLEARWEVRLAYDYGEVPEDVPFCRVGVTGGLMVSGTAWRYDVTQPMSIECMFPRPDTSDEALLNAMRLMDTLNRAFHGPGVGLGRPLRVPLWNYTGTELLDGANVWRHPHDYMRVQDFSPSLLPDPMDVRKLPVVATLRVGWRITNDPIEVGAGTGTPFKGSVLTDEIRVEGDDELEGFVVE